MHKRTKAGLALNRTLMLCFSASLAAFTSSGTKFLQCAHLHLHGQDGMRGNNCGTQ